MFFVKESLIVLTVVSSVINFGLCFPFPLDNETSKLTPADDLRGGRLELEDVDHAVKLADEITNRLGRFMFQSSSGSSNPLSSIFGGTSGSKNFLNLQLNRENILKGLFDPDNVMIHVGQNIIDVMGSSLTWILIALITGQSSSSSSQGKEDSNFDLSTIFRDYSPSAQIYDASHQISAYTKPSEFDLRKAMLQKQQAGMLSQSGSKFPVSVRRDSSFSPSQPISQNSISGIEAKKHQEHLKMVDYQNLIQSGMVMTSEKNIEHLPRMVAPDAELKENSKLKKMKKIKKPNTEQSFD